MEHYSYRVFWSEPDASYIAVCPEVPGLSAFGPTPEAATSELGVAIRMAVETYREEGWELPKPQSQGEYSGQFRLRLPRSLHANLAHAAESEGVSLNTLAVTFLSEALGRMMGPAMPEQSPSVREKKLSA